MPSWKAGGVPKCTPLSAETRRGRHGAKRTTRRRRDALQRVRGRSTRLAESARAPALLPAGDLVAAIGEAEVHVVHLRVARPRRMHPPEHRREEAPDDAARRTGGR